MDNVIKVDRSFYIFYAFILLTVPIRWALAAFLSALVHELCHITAIKLCRKRIISVNIGVLGAEIQTDIISGWQEILCLAAGPAGSLSLLLLFRWLPLTALIGAIQGLFNLLPVIPLDGGRILNSIFDHAFGHDKGAKVMCVIECILLLLLIGMAICCLPMLKIGSWPFMLIILLAVNMISRKIPCKLSQLGVQ